ncbi:hypothetical protein [Succinimonas sp.]|uniref:hypothetical protein n=1 Tax=Succinimonas sp. TaxID=1936151 RepID=UPI00387009FF
MGLKDTAAIEYFADNEIFADAFNYYFFGSRKVIKPEELQPLDSAQAATIFGTRGKVPVKRYRDILKLAKRTDKGVFVLLGMELQSEIDYGMTVRNMLYDALSYDAQIKAIENQHEQQKKSEQNVNNDSAGLTSEKGVNNIKGAGRNSSAEFLSGMTKEDKLKPVITLVINLSGKPWDGPRELLDLLDIKEDDALRPFLNNYKLHIISPDMMDDKEFLKFSTLCGFALNVVKYRYDGNGLAASIKESFSNITVDTKTKRFLKTVTKSKILEDLTKEDNMVMDAFDQLGLKMVVVGMIDALKNLGKSDEDIVNFVTKRHHVTSDYVWDLIKVWPKPLLDFNINKARDNDPAPSVPAGS